MVDTIRIKASQTMVNYRTPTSYLIRESYPLPPYSTVAGMIHSVCGFTSWRPMKISVQGRVRGITSDLFVRYTFGNQKFDKDRHQIAVPADDSQSVKLGVFRGVSHVELLCEVELVLHVLPECEEDFELILKGLNAPRVFPSLGRYEDLLDIREVKTVKLERGKIFEPKYDMFLPIRLIQANLDDLPGTTYLLHKEFEYDAKKRRRWKDTIETLYIGSRDIGSNLLRFLDVDEEGQFPVAFA
ncbi:MAG: CRISPR-associated protein Cas5 [Thermoguttaceae bacterium]|nr:CRISPR-associated protein Cas5 [Thermoguttaceae bacterium]